ncbi:DUF5919 domain-containing protein [Saccharothrix australiensis]|uniref:DUF5919 domain-containing protein n=1 Tax=Saccharothrix australiensis TaxID=2072 RepID=UPI001FEAD658|nr:DUF5919 domain-containing protein [Saccharothrix australiensis]
MPAVLRPAPAGLDRDRHRDQGAVPGTQRHQQNIKALRRVASKFSPNAQGRLTLRVYDEPIRYNIVITDQVKCVVQPYLPDARGVQSPTLVIERDDALPGLFGTFSQVFDSMWNRAKEID